jgi:hypothetical protein
MNTTLRPVLVAVLCICASGCAILPAAGVALAAQGAQGLVAVSLGSMADAHEGSEKDRCLVYANRGISITESLETAIPIAEGEVTTFEPAYWRPEFARDGYPQLERSRAPTEGTLAIGERWVLFAPPPGATSIRIPYELVQDVEIRDNTASGQPRAMIVKSCFGRFDIVTFRPVPQGGSDADSTAAAAARLKGRVAAFRTASGE